MAYSLDIEGHRALVTGGTQGLGQAIVATLREAGVRILTSARRKPSALAQDIQLLPPIFLLPKAVSPSKKRLR